MTSGKVPKNWSDNKSPRWSKFHIDLIYRVRTCGVLDSNGISRLCDICLHVRSNPIGSTLSKKEANKPKILIPRGTEEPKTSLNNFSEHNRCGNCLGEKRPGVPHPCGPASRKKNLLGLLQNAPEEDKKQILGTAIKALAPEPSTSSLTDTIQLGRVEGGHSIPITVGRIQDRYQPLLTTTTFWKIEIEMDIGCSSLLKLKRILQKEVPVESRVKEGLRSWDRLGADQLDLWQIKNFEHKIIGKK